MNRRHGTHVILGAITPAHDSVDADQLTYPNLRTVLKSQNLPSFLKRSGIELLKKRHKISPALLQEELATNYILSAAYRLQRARTMPEKVFWSTQFTSSSVALFGQPLTREVTSIATKELAYFTRAVEEYDLDTKFAAPVIEAYSSLISSRSKTYPRLEARYTMILQRLYSFLNSEYEQCFACFDGYDPGEEITPPEVVKCFNIALDVLKSRDPAWAEWKVIHDKSARLSVNGHKKRIVIGARRSPMTVGETRGLFAHEVLVHAQRTVQGNKRSPELAVGLPGYLEAEEGLGVLAESAITGTVPLKVKDRYVDIALALGAWRRHPLSRKDMYVFCYTRAVLRGVLNNEATDLDELEKITWEHVNRIYRGSLGNKYVAVFTKDVAYYNGFIKMANYLQRAAKKGRLTDALAYALRGKFDPTNKAHRKYVGHSNY